MNATIEALLELNVIDRKRQTLRSQRRNQAKLAAKALAEAEARKTDADAILAELERTDALIRQYESDAARCTEAIESLRSKQMEAKSNKEYMAIINNIEQSRLEKTHREQSLLELASKRETMAAKAEKAAAEAKTASEAAAKAQAAAEAAKKPGPEEAKLDVLYAAAKSKVEPAFLEAYERLANAGVKVPMVRVDTKTRSTPWGAVISMNQLEQIKMGKLVIASGTNQILYVDA